MSRSLTVPIIVTFFLWALFLHPPFLMPERINIPEGITINETAQLLKEGNVVISGTTFSLFSRMFGGVRFGSYVFDHPMSNPEVAWRLSQGGNAPLVRITVPEGASAREIAALLSDSLPDFDSKTFLKLGLPEEGYLFPETYFFVEGIAPRDIVLEMRQTFDEKTADLKPTRDHIIMASLLEKEARLYETRQTIAGILWKRLKLDMPLQVDAVFAYIMGTTTFSPTFDQLKIVSPYNTYTNPGLPPGPIGNPGLEAIRAAQNPIKTSYLYYLTGADGTMHYAKTFEEHKANRQYLK
jgi:UPF0755 protein